ncbi:hypothetical protein GCM10023085_52620 [Actinomadura viridis]|uniref:DUF4232 domain-containing protein n=1 Tax=Actinomadura viridis TaxID=58110 RepID=A0A931DEY5_9ACTN|nr:hypothetical protein [Actinomadura viridis]MBG6086231.1 hypothetical protein [Actinomadura viridis]
MGSDTGREGDGSGIDQYWRRRAAALAGVVVVVGVLGWACSSGGAETERERPSAAPSQPAVPTAMPTVTVTATTKVTMTPKAVRRDGDACDPEDVVVTMAVSRDTYAAGDRPRFRVTAVNTGARTCRLDVGPGALDVRITSGPDRVWSSSACARGPASSVKELRRGVPYAATVSWDRRRSGEDCEGERASARPGTYVATLKPDGYKVPRQVFRLR